MEPTAEETREQFRGTVFHIKRPRAIKQTGREERVETYQNQVHTKLIKTLLYNREPSLHNLQCNKNRDAVQNGPRRRIKKIFIKYYKFKLPYSHSL